MPPPYKKKPVTSEEAYARAAARCAVAEQCAADWKRKFLAMGLNAEEAQSVIDRLIDEGFINEERYATAYVHDKANYDRWGPIKIRQGLLQKGIGRETIDRTLATIDDSLWNINLKQLIGQKRTNLEGEDDHTRQQKLIRYAVTRGYELGAIFRFLDYLLEGDPD